jgi:cell fate (sporulation/competence/biofilm development) regulator YlbF (YheA/YmcA/DUF963 family)
MVLNPELQVATQALALALRQSPPIAAFEEAQARLEQDQEAKALLNRLREAQRRYLDKQRHGGLTQADIDAVRQAQAAVQRHPTVIAYGQALQVAQAFLPEVNLEISQVLGFDFGALAAGPGSC